MPNLILAPEQIADVIAYILSLREPLIHGESSIGVK
jgi:hypothetical protein